MKYSIVLPCFNEAHILPVTLAGIKNAIDVRNDIEVLFVDNGSTDKSVELIKSYQFTVYVVENVKISALRNYGVSRCSGEYIYFLDADMLLPDDVFSALDRFIEERQYDVLGFVDSTPEGSPWFARIWSLRTLARRDIYKQVRWLPGRNILAPKALVEKVGGFDETLLTGEDKDFVLRLGEVGAKIASDPRLQLTHLGYERTFLEWCRKEYWRQHSNLRMIIRGGFSWKLMRFPLLALFHLILFTLIISYLVGGTPPSAWMLCLWLLPSFLMTASFRVSRQPGLRFFQLWLLYFIRFHIAVVSMGSELLKNIFSLLR